MKTRWQGFSSRVLASSILKCIAQAKLYFGIKTSKKLLDKILIRQKDARK